MIREGESATLLPMMQTAVMFCFTDNQNMDSHTKKLITRILL